MTRIIVGRAKRQAHVVAALKLFKEAHAGYQRHKELVCQLITYPDATEPQILDAAASLRHTHKSLSEMKKSLDHAIFKEGMSDSLIANQFRALKL